jgi:hypothetical protein
MDIELQVFYPEPPVYAELAPTRAVYVGSADGRCEVFAWDAALRVRRQLTDRPQGTVTCAIAPSGREVWWFDDDLAGVGTWQVQPFAGGASRPAGFPAGRDAGLAMTLDGTAAAAIGDDKGGLAVYLAAPGQTPQEVARIDGYARLIDVAGGAGGALIALAGAPDALDAATLLDTAAGTRTRLAGVPDPLWAAGFAPDGRPELLLTVRCADGRYRLATWTAEQGLRALEWCAFDTEIAPSWYPDARRVLVRQERHARTTLHAVDLAARELTKLDTPEGSILAGLVQPDGDLQYIWTDSVHPALVVGDAGP